MALASFEKNLRLSSINSPKTMFRNRRIIHEEIGGEAKLLPSPSFPRGSGTRTKLEVESEGVNYETAKLARWKTPGLGGEGMTMVFLKRSETGKRWLNNEKSHEWNRVTNKKRCARVALCERTNFKSAHVWVFIKKGKIKKEGEREKEEEEEKKIKTWERNARGGEGRKRKRREEKKTDESERRRRVTRCGKEMDGEMDGEKKGGCGERARARKKKGRLRRYNRESGLGVARFDFDVQLKVHFPLSRHFAVFEEYRWKTFARTAQVFQPRENFQTCDVAPWLGCAHLSCERARACLG